jgi:hypothetical protein
MFGLGAVGNGPCKRITLTGMAQKLYEMAGDTVREFDRAQQEFNDRQMLPPRWAQPEAPMQQQQQIQPTEK